MREELKRQDLRQTWFFEKRQTDFRRSKGAVRVSLDQVPEIGIFAEIEGPLGDVRSIAELLAAYLGQQETRNYQVLFLHFKERQGFSRDIVKGAAFSQ